MNPVTTGRKADDGARVGTDKVMKITSGADIGRIRIVRWSRAEKSMFDKEGCHKFDVTLADGRSGRMNIDPDDLPNKANYCLGVFVDAGGECEYLPLYKLALASDLSELVLDLVQRRCFALLGGCVCNPIFRGLLKWCRSFSAGRRMRFISPAKIAVLQSGADTIKYLEKKDYGSVATLFRMSADELLPSICEAMATALADLRKEATNTAKHTSNSIERSEAYTMGASARDFVKSVTDIGRAMTVIRESLCPHIEDQNA